MDSGYNRNYGGPSHGGQGWDGGQYGGMPTGPGGYVQQGGHETHSIDALFGIGLSRAPEAPVAGLMRLAARVMTTAAHRL